MSGDARSAESAEPESTTCRTCGASIWLAIHEATGGVIALEPSVPPAGDFRYFPNERGAAVARPLYGPSHGDGEMLFTRHECGNGESPVFSSWPFETQY